MAIMRMSENVKWSGWTGPNFGRRGHLMLFLVVLYIIKFQTLPNNIPEGNPLKSVYLTPKIALIYRPMWSLNGPVTYISISTFSQ